MAILKLRILIASLEESQLGLLSLCIRFKKRLAGDGCSPCEQAIPLFHVLAICDWS